MIYSMSVFCSHRHTVPALRGSWRCSHTAALGGCHRAAGRCRPRLPAEHKPGSTRSCPTPWQHQQGSVAAWRAGTDMAQSTAGTTPEVRVTKHSGWLCPLFKQRPSGSTGNQIIVMCWSGFGPKTGIDSHTHPWTTSAGTTYDWRTISSQSCWLFQAGHATFSFFVDLDFGNIINLISRYWCSTVGLSMSQL